MEISVTTRYDGELEYWEGEYGSGNYGGGYRPVDEDNIRDLIDGLWGDHIAVAIRDEAFDDLTEYDPDRQWPQGQIVNPACNDCGNELDDDEVNADRGECFACYCARQD